MEEIFEIIYEPLELEQDTSKLGFSWIIKEVTAQNITLKLTFENPVQCSPYLD